MTALARTILRTLSFFLVVGGGGLLVLCLSPTPARAHPHAWIDVQSNILFDAEGQITGLRQTWLFDEFYTKFALQDFGAGQTKAIDPKKLLELGRQNLDNLKPFGYFTFMDAGQTRLTFSEYRDVASDITNNRIRLSFTLIFANPIDPQKQAVSYRIYDPSYYIDMKHVDKDGVTIHNAPSCHATLERPKPDVAIIAMAGALDKNAKAPDDLGRFFAERVRIHCKT